MVILKLERQMEAWQLGKGGIPEDVMAWVKCLPNGKVVVVSPNAPHHTFIAEMGWWLIRTEVGCIYAIPDSEFRRKYRRA